MVIRSPSAAFTAGTAVVRTKSLPRITVPSMNRANVDYRDHDIEWSHAGAFSAGMRTLVHLIPGEQLGIAVLDRARLSRQSSFRRSSRGLDLHRGVVAAARPELAQCAVPKRDPGFDATARGAQGALTLVR
jgi:hypothetical protein